jgi:2-keto-4-pentenoate hydratase/2-oxohepta-3-ene-1,7-dioic acid hydratase in catechol pathway
MRKMNYKLTLVLVREAGRKPPPFPFIFFKANTTVLDHGEPVVVPKIAQNDQADYEGELVCIHSKLISYASANR